MTKCYRVQPFRELGALLVHERPEDPVHRGVRPLNHPVGLGSEGHGTQVRHAQQAQHFLHKLVMKLNPKI